MLKKYKFIRKKYNCLIFQDNKDSRLNISKNYFIICAAVFYVIVFALSFTSCTGSNNSSESDNVEQLPITFSFFDVDVNSILSHSLKIRLDNILGDHSTESKNTINLNINNEGFLKEHLPYFEELNKKLNSPTAEVTDSPVIERVEHNTIKLAYRYSVKKNLPFNYVEFLFSEFNDTPLLIKIRFKEDNLNIVKTLKEKYGAHKEILWKEENGKSLCWEKDGDILILSFVPDQFGNPFYQVVIYFSKRLEELMKSEQLEKSKKHKAGIKSGKNVF
ncbi:membrane or secreted protein [Candidatus Magnetoovum chiemensis]|nr:membrane or secreted protein [Candidatus Magnetoovum chiemensis]